MTRWILFGIANAAFSVLAGAFGAHALRGTISEAAYELLRTASQYQMSHSLALILLCTQTKVRSRVPSSLFSAGLVLFSGSLYILALGGSRWFGMITPLGGLCFLFGWASWAWEARKGLRSD